MAETDTNDRNAETMYKLLTLSITDDGVDDDGVKKLPISWSSPGKGGWGDPKYKGSGRSWSERLKPRHGRKKPQ